MKVERGEISFINAAVVLPNLFSFSVVRVAYMIMGSFGSEGTGHAIYFDSQNKTTKFP